MAPIKDIVKLYSTGNTATTEDGRMLAFSLAEIQSELEKLSNSLSFPDIKVAEPLDLSGLETAIRELKDGFPGPLPPQDLDLNPVYRSYEQTANVLKELLGEVKTTNTRIAGIRSGGGGPSVVGISDINGNRLSINPDGSINISGFISGGSSSDIDGGNAFSSDDILDGGGA